VKLLSVVGTRPQFVKAAALSPVLGKKHDEILVNTGQHYDYELARAQFDALGLREPEYNLDVGSGTHARQTASMMVILEDAMLKEKPDLVVLYGDTNSTLAGALSASKLGIPLAHVESGPRQHDLRIPEEINRVIADRLSFLRFAPTGHTVENLRNEGITEGVHLTGDVMYDIFLKTRSKIEERSGILDQYGVSHGKYILMTLHRPHNSDNKTALQEVMNGVRASGERVLFPVHPRTLVNLERFEMMAELKRDSNISLVKPVDYLDMVTLMRNARIIVTDSGGVTREAYFCEVPSVSIEEVTPWPEVAEAGWSQVTGADADRIANALENFAPRGPRLPIFGDGDACGKIVDIISSLEDK